MFAGHFGVAAAVKAKRQEVPLWALMGATQLLDIVFVPMLLSGAETIDSSEGVGYGKAIIHADFTHSIVGALVLAVLAGLLAWKAWGKRSGVTIGAVVFSHWLLDLLVHRPDLPVLPGNVGDLPLMGFGLWKIPAASAAVELLLVVVGMVMYGLSLRLRGAHLANKSKVWTAGIVMGILLGLSLLTDVFGI
ncbi:permease [Cohnella pontilimi]|uniref:Permease n=1 Tax=Cohnella pontilimi TaxID=2564100 RepID=A0A4U0FDB3_9BACL|nr:permease [Cohnella pontilimi]TJY42244.1 permease [Cohnella pontilimi]